jgi:hypothetical protein
MAHHHISDRRLRLLPDRRAQVFAISEAAAGIGDEDAIAADDEAYVGDGVVIGRARVFVDAAADVDALGDLVGGEGAWGRESPPQRSRQAAEAKPAERKAAARNGSRTQDEPPKSSPAWRQGRN